ncbi:MAG: type IV secretion system DNA-binding domain-containing protein [Pseudomonas sp.]|nr:type IV secretion system DNA-binding domain-containing protein [Pseudomonas sp.]
MYATRILKDKVLGRSPVLSFEIVSTKKDGIRYLVQVEKSRSLSLQKVVAAYVPDVKVKEVKAPKLDASHVIEFKQTGHYVLPLTPTLGFVGHDPLSYVTNAMTKLDHGEQIVFQLVLSPVKLRGARKLARKILSNEDILTSVRSGGFIWLQGFSDVINRVLWGAADLTSEVYRGTTSGVYTTQVDKQDGTFKNQVAKRQRPARTLSSFELELMESMHRKVTQPLFQVSMRVMSNGEHAAEHLQALRSALDGYSVPLYQSLKAKVKLPLVQRYRQTLATHRLPALFRRGSLVLSAAEVASLYHFPSSRISQTDNLITSLSKTLPAPVSLKSGRKLAVTIGDNHHHGIVTQIGLIEAERARHLYVIGGTGNGKTTMLFYSILQDIRTGNGIAVIDPHGDLAERILRYIPEDRIKDIVYMNPDDLAHPIGMNLLELSPDLSGDDLLREKDLITEATISVLRKVFSEDDSGGHRIEYVLRNAIQTALTLENSTLFTIFELLNDAKFRRKVVKSLEDKNLKDFWSNEIGKAGEFQRVKMAAGITAKIGRFLFSASARRVLEQPRSTINFEDIIASRKILICNFSKGALGEDTSALFGTTVLAKLQTAALRRARIKEASRTPYYLYVDEFQNFATMSFVQMLSEARKYKLFLTMAEQSTSQQDQQRLVDIILANVGTIVCFRSGSPADERLVLPLFSPFINQGEIANLPAYSYYARIAAIEAQEPMSGVTVVVEDLGSTEIAKQVIGSSRELYAKRIDEQLSVGQITKSVSESRKNQLIKKADKELSGISAVK